MKKLVPLILASAITFGTSYGMVSSDSGFTDVKAGHWAKNTIQSAVNKGYVSGYPGGLFKPDQAISRSEFIKMVVSALDLPTDKANGSWYEPYVKAAQAEGMYSSADYTNSEAEWNKNITRKEMAKIAARAIGQTTNEDDKWMYLATKAGLITGLGKGELGENKTTTRAQSVTIIERILTVKNGGQLPVDKYAVGSAEIAWHGTNIFTVMPEMLVPDESRFTDKQKGKTLEELWDEEKMIIDSPDGKYRGQLEALIAIDVSDPNDPNWSLLPPKSKLKWFNGYYEMDNLKVMDWPNSYILYFKGEQVYNKDKKMYSPINYVNFSIIGFESPDDAQFYKGTLNGKAYVYKKAYGDIPALVIPKKGTINKNDYFTISIITPATSNFGYKYQYLLDVPVVKNE